MPKSKESLKEIYALIIKSLKATITNIDKSIMHYRTVDYHSWNDNDFLETMAQVIFASSLDWDIVEKKWSAIKQAFGCFDLETVANYTNKDVNVLMKKPDIIKHKQRIKSIIQNAKEMQEIIQEYGSFKNFICYYPYDLKQKLVDTFYGLGEQTVLDFMKEMGFPVIKDDEHIRRVFYRLGLTGSEDVEQEEILKIGREIAIAVGEKMPVIDCVFWSFGHYICKSSKPDCKKCYLTNLCKQKR
jgi:DNA-3-methyladenine glycosylase I